MNQSLWNEVIFNWILFEKEKQPRKFVNKWINITSHSNIYVFFILKITPTLIVASFFSVDVLLFKCFSLVFEANEWNYIRYLIDMTLITVNWLMRQSNLCNNFWRSTYFCRFLLNQFVLAMNINIGFSTNQR